MRNEMRTSVRQVSGRAVAQAKKVGARGGAAVAILAAVGGAAAAACPPCADPAPTTAVAARPLAEGNWLPGNARDLRWQLMVGIGGGPGGSYTPPQSVAAIDAGPQHTRLARNQSRFDLAAAYHVLPWLAAEARLSSMGTFWIAGPDDRDQFSATQGTLGARLSLPMTLAPVLGVQVGGRRTETLVYRDQSGQPAGYGDAGSTAFQASDWSMALGAEAGLELAVEHLVLGAFGYAQGAAFGAAPKAGDALAEAESLATGLSFRAGYRF